jgi:hypothetical protein
MSEPYFPHIEPFEISLADNPQWHFQIQFRRLGGYVVDLPTAIRLRDRLTQAIDDAQEEPCTTPKKS